MPSCEPALVQAMAQHLLKAAQNEDWNMLSQLDLRVQQWLQELGLVCLSDEQRSAWIYLAEAHAEAQRLCRQRLQDVAGKLKSLDQQQEAQKAYAWQEVLG